VQQIQQLRSGPMDGLRLPWHMRMVDRPGAIAHVPHVVQPSIRACTHVCTHFNSCDQHLLFRTHKCRLHNLSCACPTCRLFIFGLWFFLWFVGTGAGRTGAAAAASGQGSRQQFLTICTRCWLQTCSHGCAQGLPVAGSTRGAVVQAAVQPGSNACSRKVTQLTCSTLLTRFMPWVPRTISCSGLATEYSPA
jgi:hypothetical protein